MHLLIEGGRRLSGTISIEGAKNAVLPACAASLLTDDPVVIHRAPPLRDVRTILAVIEELGKDVLYETGTITIFSTGTLIPRASKEYVERMRASFLVLGPLLARLGRAEVPLPGGCTIGPRPVDYHLQGLREFGAEVREERDRVFITAEKLQGMRFRLPYPSVGATEQLLMAASLADGITTIENPSREPEVLDLVALLKKMGARIEDANGAFVIEGVSVLRGAEHAVIPDRLEAGTYLIAGAITGGEVEADGAREEHLTALIAALESAGATVETGNGRIRVKAGGGIRPLDVETAPFPGFPTDLQPPLVALLSLAEGVSTVRETVFPTRFSYVGELARMGARISVSKSTATITGVNRLNGALLTAPDIRAGAALVLAALAARGESRIEGLEQIDRGYADLEKKLTSLGAEIVRRKEK